VYENKPAIRHPDDKRFFMIFSLFRSASRWLTFMLNENAKEHVSFRHEGWHPDCFAEIDEEWRLGNPGIYGSVGYAGYWCWSYIMREFKPKVVFLWREPISQARSMLCRKQWKGDWFISEYYSVLAVYESILRRVEADQTSVTHWHFDRYTTHDGFVEMCQHLGIGLRRNIKISSESNATRPKNRRPFEPFEDCVREALEHFPRCKAAREAAAAACATVVRPECVMAGALR
jgi:hypothetical protein